VTRAKTACQTKGTIAVCVKGEAVFGNVVGLFLKILFKIVAVFTRVPVLTFGTFGKGRTQLDGGLAEKFETFSLGCFTIGLL